MLHQDAPDFKHITLRPLYQPVKNFWKILFYLTDTGEDSKLVHMRTRPKVDTLFFSLFSDAAERRVWLSAESKILASTFGHFRLYRLNLKNMKISVNSFSILPELLISNLTNFAESAFPTLRFNIRPKNSGAKKMASFVFLGTIVVFSQFYFLNSHYQEDLLYVKRIFTVKT